MPAVHSGNLPKYVPEFFPEFPEIKEDNAMEETNNSLTIDSSLKEKAYQPVISQTKAVSNEPLPPPLIVRNKKKPVDNPFSHIVPFEDSNLASERNTAQPPLSLIMKPNSRPFSEEETANEQPRKKMALSVIKLLSD